jgi:hypothetical protein
MLQEPGARSQEPGVRSQESGAHHGGARVKIGEETRARVVHAAKVCCTEEHRK